MLLLDDTSETALAVDVRIPPSAERLSAALVRAWPRLAGRVELASRPLEEVELRPGDLVVSAHACGDLTDAILTRAIEGGARVAVLPCCQVLRTHGDLDGWLDKALKWRHGATPFLDTTIVLAPDPAWVAQLPNRKLPDRTDFTRYGNDLAARVKA